MVPGRESAAVDARFGRKRLTTDEAIAGEGLVDARRPVSSTQSGVGQGMVDLGSPDAHSHPRVERVARGVRAPRTRRARRRRSWWLRHFWFMREKVVDGICAGTGMALSVVLVALTWKTLSAIQQHRPGFCLDSVHALGCRCIGHFLPVIPSNGRTRRAVSTWKTYNEFANHPFRGSAKLDFGLFALPLAYIFGKRYGWKQSDEPHDANAVGVAS